MIVSNGTDARCGLNFKCVVNILILVSSFLSAEGRTIIEEHLNNNVVAEKKEDPTFVSDFSSATGGKLLIDNTELNCQFHTNENGIRICQSNNLNSTNQTGNSIGEMRPEKLRILIISALSLSIFFLLLHVILFILISEMRTLSGCCLASLCVSLMIAYIFFLSLTSVNIISMTVCVCLAIGIYYFFFVSFFWMNVLAFEVWRSLRRATDPLAVTPDDSFPKRRFLFYSCYAWLVPLFLAIVTLIIESSDQMIPEKYRPGFQPPSCCLKEPLALLIFFTGPFSFLMGLNVILFGASACIIRSAFVKSAKMMNVKTEIIKLILHLRLMLLMGFTWAFYISYRALTYRELFCAFVIANAFQALFILVTFSCVPKLTVDVARRLVRFVRRNKVSPSPPELGSVASAT